MCCSPFERQVEVILPLSEILQDEHIHDPGGDVGGAREAESVLPELF